MNPRKREVLQLTIPSRTEYLSIVNRVTEEISDQAGLGEDDKNSVATAVIEAATNAIQHGNKNDPAKNVRVRFMLNRHRLEVTVTDQGRGFDPRKVDDPLKPENMLRERGRGIFIIRSFMDAVRFGFRAKRGMSVTLVKHLAPHNAQEQAGR
jgi:serine/threonine-protein kinase RsbW